MPLLPRSTPAAEGVSSRALAGLLDRLGERSIELHSLMVVRHGRVVAEGWWAPYTADRPHQLFSLTKSFVSIAVGLAIHDGLLSLDDRVAAVLPEHAPGDVPDQAGRLTVHHLLSMTAGRERDIVDATWPDLAGGFLRLPFDHPEGTRFVYDNAATYVLARIVERVTGRELPEFLDERLLGPMGIEPPEWDRMPAGEVHGFSGLHLTTEAVAAFGELLLRGGRWGDRQLVPAEWIALATREHVGTEPPHDGYGYQFWMSPHGYLGSGLFGQQCLVVPSRDLVVAVTAAVVENGAMPGPIWDVLLPGLDDLLSPDEDEAVAERLRGLALPAVTGDLSPGRSVTAKLTGFLLPDGTEVQVAPGADGWTVRLGPIPIAVGYGTWPEGVALGKPVVAAGAWQGDTFVADVYLITTPHHFRLEVDANTGMAAATWHTTPVGRCAFPPPMAVSRRTPRRAGTRRFPATLA